MSLRSLNQFEQVLLLLSLAFLGTCGGGSWGCRGAGGKVREPVLIQRVVDRTSGAPENIKFDLDQARRILQSAVEETKTLRLADEEDPRAYRAELVVTFASERGSESSREGGVYRTIHVELLLSRWGANHEREKLSSTGKSSMVQDNELAERQGGFDQILEKAIQQSVQFVDLQMETRYLPLAELEAMLGSEDAEDRLYVLRALRDRPAPALIDRIIEKLSDSDPEVILEAVGVLVAQRDQRAVLPLIRTAQGRDQAFLLQNITALGEIGGPVARGYLFTLAAGHSSPVVRQRAAEALQQVSIRSAEVSEPTQAAAVPTRAGPKQEKR